jgi:hypothetical protein
MPDAVTGPPAALVAVKETGDVPAAKRAHDVTVTLGIVSVQLAIVTLSSAPVTTGPPLAPAVIPTLVFEQITAPTPVPNPEVVLVPFEVVAPAATTVPPGSARRKDLRGGASDQEEAAPPVGQ